MSACDFDKLLSPYHDGEVSPERAVEVERHLLNCPQCAEHLASMRLVSERLASIELQDITGRERSGIHRAVNSAIPLLADGAIMRMAVPLAALAASVLLVTSIWLVDTMNGSTPHPQVSAGPADWEHVAVTLQSDSRLPDWMVRSLGGDAP